MGGYEKKSRFQLDASEVMLFFYDWAETISQSLIVVIFVLTFVFRLFTVKGNSMLDTLHSGDKVLVWKYNYTPTKGDVVTVKKFGKLDESIVKRVIATEGDSLSIDFDSGLVYVNGKKLNETYIREPMKRRGNELETPSVVPKGTCFLMGDNRNHSDDSRSPYIGGPVKNSDIIGPVKFIYFPFHHIGPVKRQVG